MSSHEDSYQCCDASFVTTGVTNYLVPVCRCHKTSALKCFLLLIIIIVATFLFHVFLFPKNFVAHRGKIVKSSTIQRRPLNAYDIGILIIVTEKMDLSEYQMALDTLRCYSSLHYYDFYVEEANSTWKMQCNQSDFMFLRHCMTSNLLHRNNWTLFLDADVGVVNPSKLIDTFVKESENEADIIFFDRFFNQEIAAGSYLVKNSSYSKNFLMKFANTEFSMPKNIVGSDNGAIHWLFIEQFFGNETELLNDCYKMWEMCNTFEDYLVFQAYIRLIFGKTMLFHNPNEEGTVKLIPKGKGWMRDVWLIENKWSLEADFMLHGWKKSVQMPVTTDNVTTFGRWWSVLANSTFDHESCSNGTIEWQWWATFMISKLEHYKLFMDERTNVQQKSKMFENLISQYIHKKKYFY